MIIDESIATYETELFSLNFSDGENFFEVHDSGGMDVACSCPITINFTSC